MAPTAPREGGSGTRQRRLVAVRGVTVQTQVTEPISRGQGPVNRVFSRCNECRSSHSCQGPAVSSSNRLNN